tara:strand:- start:20202 stop:20660 length:459 start_codon:yes stop_codon:yes gene_type:complete
MIRDIKPIDHDFIYHSWLHSVKCPTRAVTSMTRRLIDSLVEEKKIKIWCPDDDENHIIGWMAFGEIEKAKLLHFVFVKKNFRNNEIGKELLYSIYPDRNEQVFCTYWSHHMQKIDARHKWNVKFVANLLPAKIYNLMEDTPTQPLEVIHGAA